MRAEDEAHSRNLHIYLICRRPFLFFKKDSFKYEEGKISGEIGYKIDGNEKTFGFSSELPLLDGAVSARLSEYPHREVQTIDEKGEIVRYLPASVVCTGLNVHGEIDDLQNLEVLYVGQAFGSGNRTAVARLKSHSTFQKILAATVYESPDSEIYTLAFEYDDCRLLTSFDGRSSGTIQGNKDQRRFKSILDNPLKKSQRISVVEAALIRYFQPHYNVIYKKKFPSRELKVLKECYELDVSGLVVEIDTSDFNFHLFSQTISPNYHHIACIDLIDDKSRASFFHLPDPEGKVVKLLSNVISSAENS